MRKLILSSSLFSVVLFAEANYNVILDPHFSPYAGADDLLVAHRMLEKTPLSQYGKPLFDSSSSMSKLGRASELTFVWGPINYTTMVAQHEVFGHGFRVRSMRESGAEVLKYKIGVPPPYGHGGGATLYKFYPSENSVFAMSNVITGGIKSTAILANRVRMQWLKEGTILPSQASLYDYAQQDITNYILLSSLHDDGDISEYVHLMNKTYQGGNLSIKKLKTAAYFNFLDPFTFYSIMASWNYILYGKSGIIPMIPMGSYRYLPSFRMGLSPYGAEYYLENFLVKVNSPIYFYLRGGKFAGHNYSGLGVEYPTIWEINEWKFGFKSDLWLQPRVHCNDSQYSYQRVIEENLGGFQVNGTRFGSALSLLCQKDVWDQGAFFMQLGGKTQGFLLGEDLDGGMIFRIGIMLW